MTFEEIVEKVREDYEGADARQIHEHIAVEFELVGEVEGTFYIEIANRQICVEPYDYFDKDAKVIVDLALISRIVRHEITFEEAFNQHLFEVKGDLRKAKVLKDIYVDKVKNLKRDH